MGRQDTHLSYPCHSRADSYWERAWDLEDSVRIWSGSWAYHHLTFPHYKHLGHLEDLEVYPRGRKKKRERETCFDWWWWRWGRQNSKEKESSLTVFTVVCWFGDIFLRKSLRSFWICLFPFTNSNTRKTLTKSVGDNALGNWNYSVEAIWRGVWYSWNSWGKTP